MNQAVRGFPLILKTDILPVIQIAGQQIKVQAVKLAQEIGQQMGAQKQAGKPVHEQALPGCDP